MFFDNPFDELEYFINESVTFKEYNKIAFVENEEDIRFWSYIFKKFNSNLNIDFRAYCKHIRKSSEYKISTSQGKQQILKYREAVNKHDGNAFICIDSDYDYILNNYNVNDNPYILQTFVYSIESYICCAKSLNELCDELLFPRDTFDFIKFFKRYSETINDLFLYHILLKDEDNNIQKVFKCFFSEIDKINQFEDIKNLYTLYDLEIKVEEEIKKIKIEHPNIQNRFDLLKKSILEDALINDDTLYMHISGHLIYDLTVKILTRIQVIVHRVIIEDIKTIYEGKQLGEKVLEIKAKKSDIPSVLSFRYNFCYKENFCPSFNLIIEDLEKA